MLQSSEVGPFCPFLPIFDQPTLEGYNHWSKKGMKNMNTYLKSVKLKDSEKYEMKCFGQVEKIFFVFHFHFSISLKNFKALNFSTQNYLFNEVLLLITLRELTLAKTNFGKQQKSWKFLILANGRLNLFFFALFWAILMNFRGSFGEVK